MENKVQDSNKGNDQSEKQTQNTHFQGIQPQFSKPVQRKQKQYIPIQAKNFNGEPLQPVQTKQGRFATIQAKQKPVQRKMSKSASIAQTMGTQYGVDTSGLQINHNSGFPGKVGAEATIQGNKIDFAPGKDTEKNIKHEVGHYIINTQRGTPPKADKTVNGQAINTSDEKAADKIADTPLQRKAETNSDKIFLTKTGSSQVIQNKVIQRYTTYSADQQSIGKSRGWREPGGRDLHVADDGKLAVVDNQEETKDAWALKSKITEGNNILTKQESQIVMKPGGSEIKGRSPKDGKEQTLTKVKLEAATGGPAKLVASCGSAALQGIGAHLRKYAGITHEEGKDGFENFTNLYDYTGGRGLKSPAGKISSEIYQRIMLKEYKLRLTRKEALVKFEGLSKDEKARVNKKYGINNHAVPKPGQAIMIGAEDDMPGFKSEGELNRGKDGTWNFHFATAIMASGSDYVTAENYAPDKNNPRTADDWHFKMFGPAEKQQDFHYSNAEVDHGFGSRYSTIVVNESSAFISNKVAKKIVSLLSQLTVPKEKTMATTNAHGVRLIATMPGQWDNPSHYELLPKGSKLEIVKEGKEWSIVKVTVGGKDKQGWVSNIFLEKSK